MANEMLRRRREATLSPSGTGLPMTRAELAEAVNHYIWQTTGRDCCLDVDTLARYERGLIRWPGAAYRAGLRAVLGAGSDADLGFHPTRRGRAVSNRPRPRHELRAEEPATNDGAMRRLAEIEAAYDTSPAAILLADAAQLLADLNGRDKADSPLLVARASAATLLGKIVWDASERRDGASPRRYYQQAAAFAAQAGDRVGEAGAWLRTCYVALYSDKEPTEALALARRTADVASRSSKTLAGLGLLHAAEALAMLGDAREAHRALADAETLLEKASDHDPAAGWFSPETLDRMAGSVYLSLGEGLRAEHTLLAALACARPGSKAQAILTGNIALSLVRRRLPDQAAAVLAQAIDVVEATRGGGGLSVAFQAGRELAPWRDLDEVRDVRERLLTLVAP